MAFISRRMGVGGWRKRRNGMVNYKKIGLVVQEAGL